MVVSNSASTYTLTQNASIVATQTFIWDTKQYENQQNRLQNAFYTLAVFDAAAGITAAPEPGRLSPYGINAQMGLYSTQQYTPLASKSTVWPTWCGYVFKILALTEAS